MQRTERRLPRRLRQRLPSGGRHFPHPIVYMHSRRVRSIEDAVVLKGVPHHKPKVSLHPRLSCCSLTRALLCIPGNL